MIDRAYTKAEARYIPNGPNSTADMAHPTRTGDLVVFSYPPYQFDAATPGTLIARSAFFGQHGYVPDVQDLQVQHEHARHVPRRRPGDRARRGRRRAQRSTSRRRPRSCSASRSRSTARASSGATCSTTGDDYTPISIVGLNDFHGQLEPSHDDLRQRLATCRSAARRSSPRCSTRRRAALPGPTLLLAGRRQRRRLAAELGAARGHADDRRRERVGARRDERSATTSSTTASARILKHEARANFPFLSANIVETRDRQAAGLDQAVDRVPRQRRPGRRDRRDRQEHAGAGRARATPRACSFLDEARADQARVAATCARQGVKVQVVVIHEGAAAGANAIGGQPARAVDGPDHRRSSTRCRTRPSTS